MDVVIDEIDANSRKLPNYCHEKSVKYLFTIFYDKFYGFYVRELYFL